MAKHEAPREDGTKGYLVTVNNWGRVKEIEVYAKDASSARYEAVGRPSTGIYVAGVKRKPAPDPTPMPEGRRTP